MTVFSSVTATLSPELASCMKAKGKTWKEAFFVSLKTLVGVDYTVYKKESQWQIKGEWDAIKRAHHILAKVASIEKDAIAEYQAANNIRVTRLRPAPLTATPPRPRGRPPKHRPAAPTPPSVEPLQTEPLPPKRKRGRPRKVKFVPEYVKPESDSDHHNDNVQHDVGPVEARKVGKEEAFSKIRIQPQELGCQAQEQQTKDDSSFQGDQQKSKETKNETANKDQTEDVDKQPESAVKSTSSSAAGPEEIKDESVMERIEEKSTPDQFADVMISVAKEAILSAGHGSQSSVTQTEVHQKEREVPKHTPSEQIESEQETDHSEDSGAILDYLGIKHKATIEEPPDDHEKTAEQNKNLENLIEIMIEKMNTVHSEPKAVVSGLKYICTECPYTSNKKTFLREHMRRQHLEVDLGGIEPPHLNPSTISTTSTGICKRRLYHCTECDYSTNSRKHLKEHRLRKHREKTLTCAICNKKFAVTRDLSRHMKDHKTSSVRYPCKICGKKYKQFYVLKRHEKTHEAGYVKPVFPCGQCSKSFAAKQVLQIHINAVHLGNRPSYPCDTCSKNFTTKHSLAEHQLIHSNSKPYVCSICNKAFRHESTLKTHERLHTDTTQRYTCEYCGKAFRLRSSLRIHRNIHTGDKRFECPVCRKKFTQKQSLLRHARIHTGEKPFTCELCGSSFYDYSILRRHVTGVHKMQWKSPTQHYVLPPGNYHEGRIIEPPEDDKPAASQPQSSQPTQSSQPPLHEDSLPQQGVTNVQHQGQLQQHHSHAAQPQLSRHPNHAPQPQPMQHGMHTLAMPPLSAVHSSEHQCQVEKHLQNSSGPHNVEHQPPQRHQQSYHSLNQKVYQPPHIPLPNTLPSNLPMPQPQPMESPSPSQLPPQSISSPPPPMHSPPPPQHPMSPMTMAQYPQPHATPAMSLPSAYTLNPHLYYPNHH